MSREVERRDLHGDAEKPDRIHTIVLSREIRRTLAKGEERGIAVLERNERSRETAVRVDVAVLVHELAIGGLGLTQPPAREELRGGLAREAVVVWRLRLDSAPLLGERLRELACLLVVHDPACSEPRALREREDVGPLDIVRVDAQRVQLA